MTEPKTDPTTSDRYNPQEVEKKLYAFWEEKAYFKAQDVSTKPPFSILLPPPNVTGFLHLGHALDHAIQDCLIRWKRMSGFNTVWLPGTDHAGIATQSVVEKELKKKNISRRDLGREKFEEKIWDWKKEYGDRIYNQMKRLGDSCDWSRTLFTLDEKPSQAVRKVFVSLFKRGLIYRGKRLVNWSTGLETAISDLEVEYKEIKGTLTYLRYYLDNSENYLVVATTRPETLLGDVAVCVHPEDERYQSYIGSRVKLPLTDRWIPVIADAYVDKTFGTGVLKITPAHDFNDFQIGKKHQLPLINILNKNGTLNENGLKYAGLKTQEARKRMIEDLKKENFLEKEEPYTHSVGHCEKSGTVMEPLMSDQWFMKMSALVVPARRVVETGTIRFEPDSWTKVYLHWLNNIEDWCISRQLWWGHRIPVWTCAQCDHQMSAESAPTTCEKCQSTELKQDPDVLDTWFSSALWPMTTLGWPEKTESLKTFYPTSTLVTGHDIIFFWVARMIILGLEFEKDVPFRTVILHGLVRDQQGRKMSKSLGNSIDPVEMIEKYGLDALRFSMLAHIHSGKDLKMSEQRIEGYRNFMNKIWNASRFVLQNLTLTANDLIEPLQRQQLSAYDQWIIQKLSHVIQIVEESLEQNRFSEAAQAIYHFIWYEYCDWYIEFAKPYLQTSEKNITQKVLIQVLDRTLKLLHPFAPFISEEIYQKLPIKKEALVIEVFPTTLNEAAFLSLRDEKSSYEIDLLKEVISAIRNIRGENRISPAEKLKVTLSPVDDITQKVLGLHKATISSLARLSELKIEPEKNFAKCAVSSVQAHGFNCVVVIPLEGLVDFNEEIKRLQKNLEKAHKDIEILSKKLSNENYLKNADKDLVQQDQLLLEKAKNLQVSISESLIRFN